MSTDIDYDALLSTKRVWVDMETTGLRLNLDEPLELGLVVTDFWGGVEAEASWLVMHNDMRWITEELPDEFVKQMHTKSGLWHALINETRYSKERIEYDAVDFLQDAGIKRGKAHWHGSTVGYDKAFAEVHFPSLYKFMHYRTVDVSSLKIMCSEFNPEMYAKLDAAVPKRGSHRTLSDLHDSINEWQFYVHNFFWIQEDL